jgi:hypothetical protein
MWVFFYLLNFFFLDRDPKKCAHYHGDKHLNKMQLEYAQIVSSVWWLVGKDLPYFAEKIQPNVYKMTHKSHPIVQWACQSQAHVLGIIEVGLALAEEKVMRASKSGKKKWKLTHKSTPILQFIKQNLPPIENTQWHDPPACMPDCLKTKGKDVVECYRLYYAGHKVELTNLKWEPYVEEPRFLNEYKKRVTEMQDVMEEIETERKKKIKK